MQRIEDVIDIAKKIENDLMLLWANKWRPYKEKRRHGSPVMRSGRNCLTLMFFSLSRASRLLHGQNFINIGKGALF